MNKTLSALMTKLQWQLAELSQQLRLIDQQIADVDNQCSDNLKKITDASSIPAFILPEREIARLQFMIRQQQHQDELNKQKANLLSQLEAIIHRQKRLNTELKMLELHQENQLKTTENLLRIKEQNQLDEWVLQQKDRQ